MRREFKDKFDNDGFVVIEDFLTESEVDRLKEESFNLIKNIPEQSSRAVFSNIDFEQNKNQYFFDSADKIRYLFESSAIGPNGELLVDAKFSLNKVGHALHVFNDQFRKITFDERVKESCFQLGYDDPIVVQSMYIFKNPNIGGLVAPHQDSTYLHTEPESLVGFWIALDDATTENGCLWFARGSHKSGVHRRYVRNNDSTSNELLIYDKPTPHYPKSNFTPVPVKKGTCVLIHGRVLHFSEANKSDKPRNAYTFHIVDKKSKYSEENWLQPTEVETFLSVYKN